jgi:hypothetical protein
MGVYYGVVPIARRKRCSFPVNMGILIFENSFVVLEIFDFGTVRCGPNPF